MYCLTQFIKAGNPLIDGLFYALKRYRSCTPVQNVNASAAFMSVRQRERQDRFFFSALFNFNIMSYTKKQSDEVGTRKIRCLTKSGSSYLQRHERIPSISLAGLWLKQAGFDVGDLTRIIVSDKLLVISCEKIPENLRGVE